MNATLIATLFALGAAITWGTGDFVSGLSSRKIGALHALLLSYIFGLIGLIALAFLSGESWPTWPDLLWGAFSGIVGLTGFIFLLQGFAIGRIGVVAPLSAILSAAIPVLFTAINVSLPSNIQLSGFAIALLSIWMITRRDVEEDRPAGVRLAILAGLGFAGFFIILDQISDQAAFWPLAVNRISALFVMMLYIQFSQKKPSLKNAPWRLLVPMGLLDVIANFFFLKSVQAGRLDITSVLVSLYPAITVLLARIVIKEQLNRFQIFGVILAVLAVVLISS